MTTISGYIERITYFNEENGFVVARLKEKEKRELTTVVGSAGLLNTGESVRLSGSWVEDKKYGEQFRFQSCETTVPATAHGIERYLGSGLIKGVGPVMAKRIVQAFGEKTLEIIDAAPEKLCAVEGIGPVRVEMIKQSWAVHKGIKELMLFLQEYGVGVSHCARIYKAYGKEAVAKVKENPYRLAAEIWGIGFLTADNMARKMGFAPDSLIRAKEGVIHVLNSFTDEGHVFCPEPLLLDKAAELLETGTEIVAAAINELAAAADRRIVLQEGGAERAVYLKSLHVTEVRLAEKMVALKEKKSSLRPVDPVKVLPWAEQKLGLKLADKQKEAVAAALQSKVMIITGGPGTGKTTIITAVLEIFKGLRARVVLTAPTGRAAKRIQETTGCEAKTIHRLLGFSPGGGFKHDEDNPIEADVLIVDEASMIDILLMYNLIKALPDSTLLVLVGDVDQLPSVGPGNVLRDLIDCGVFKTVALNEIFRQSRQSRIIVNAHRINSGLLPDLHHDPAGSDFYFIQEEEPEQVVAKLLRVVCDRAPKKFGFDPKTEVQVLSPMHRGLTGVGNLNTALQGMLNPRGKEFARGSRVIRVGDKVLQLVNNYEKEVFNGDIGLVEAIDEVDQEFRVNYDGRSVSYDYSEMDEVTLAYAVSVHKAQGSEYPAVVILVTMQHYMLLQRNLLYTAITRGKKLVVIIGTKKALAIAVKNNKPLQRYTRLKERLITLAGQTGALPQTPG
ncbi:MAG: ATP-dependent RecD-like DNA helicase [Bacillota bacterium]